jgi:hypothetical protein
MSTDDRDILLTAIAKARAWIDDIVERRVASFAEIAKQEGKVERHIRLLAPLAFVSPRIITDIIGGVAPSITVTELANVPLLDPTQRLPDFAFFISELAIGRAKLTKLWCHNGFDLLGDAVEIRLNFRNAPLKTLCFPLQSGDCGLAPSLQIFAPPPPTSTNHLLAASRQSDKSEYPFFYRSIRSAA